MVFSLVLFSIFQFLFSIKKLILLKRNWKSEVGGMTEGNYDEDLERNPFFESLRTKAPNLFTEALDRKLYVGF